MAEGVVHQEFWNPACLAALMTRRFEFRSVRSGVLFSLFGLVAYTASGMITAADLAKIEVTDTDGAAARAGAPVSAEVTLSGALLEAADGGRLQLIKVAAGANGDVAVPAQFEPDPAAPSRGQIWWLMPPGKSGRREFRVSVARDRPDSLVKLVHDEPTGAVDISHDGTPMLRYNFKMVQPPEKTRKIMKTNDYVRKYAIQRCDYIHPLYGPGGEVLTADFPHDHAHHRGVFWSWSDVIYKKEKRSIFALQGVFERPVCLRRLRNGPVFALIEAENVWKWDDIEPIVNEIAIIRAFPAGDGGKFIDFHFRFTSLVDGLEIHRGHCGSLIMRPARLADRETNIFEDPEGVAVRRCWGELSGTPGGGKQPVGMAIIPKSANPYSPNTCKFSICLQSSFPSGKAGKRPIRNHPLPKGETLVLEYRLWVHPGRATEKELSDVWAAYNRPSQSGVKNNCK